MAVHVGAGAHAPRKEPAYIEAMKAACKAGASALTIRACAGGGGGSVASGVVTDDLAVLHAVEEATAVLEVGQAQSQPPDQTYSR